MPWKKMTFVFILIIKLCEIPSPHQTLLSFFGWFQNSAFAWTSLHSQRLHFKSHSGEKAKIMRRHLLTHFSHFKILYPKQNKIKSLLTFTTRALNEEINQVQKGDVAIIFICLNPVINNRLKNKTKIISIILITRNSERGYKPPTECLPTCVALFPSLTTSNRLMVSIPFSWWWPFIRPWPAALPAPPPLARSAWAFLPLLPVCWRQRVCQNGPKHEEFEHVIFWSTVSAVDQHNNLIL